MPDEEIRRIKVERLMPGDIILTASSGKMSKAIRLASKGQVSHAMICVQHGSVIDSTDDGVQAHNIQRELYGPDGHIAVLRLRRPLTDVQLGTVIDFARSEIGTRYSRSEAARSVLPGLRPRTKQLFCSRLVARAFASAAVHLVPDPDYCTPEHIRRSPLLAELPDMTEPVSQAELAAWAARPNPIAEMQEVQNRILTAARDLDPSVENFNDLDRLVQDHPEWDERIARVYRDSGYLDLWQADYAINPWHYDLDAMEASAGSFPDRGLLAYCISTIREFHTGGLRFAVNLIHYQQALATNGRRTTAQLVALYRQLVVNDQTRREVALGRLRRHHPGEAALHLQRITPHSELWFAIVDRVEPRLAAIARLSIERMGTADICSACGDPVDDYRLVNAAEAMPGVPSLRLCGDCVGIRRDGGEVLEPFA
ncbi:YiiX/YebB-like N1pC/P60 family cysteine hydrolase [Sphingobium scionense]